MMTKKQEFLNHVSMCRQAVALWPSWKQDIFKPPAGAKNSDIAQKEQSLRAPSRQ
jgi:hypothetical protein